MATGYFNAESVVLHSPGSPRSGAPWVGDPNCPRTLTGCHNRCGVDEFQLAGRRTRADREHRPFSLWQRTIIALLQSANPPLCPQPRVAPAYDGLTLGFGVQPRCGWRKSSATRKDIGTSQHHLVQSEPLARGQPLAKRSRGPRDGTSRPEQLREPERRIRRDLKSRRTVAARLRWSLDGHRPFSELPS